MGKEILLFRSFEQAEREAVEAGGKLHRVGPGHTFLQVGSKNTSLFIVITGSVRVTRPGAEHETELARLSSGALFGELSFLDGSRTSASVVAVEPTEVLELGHDTLDRMMEQHPALAAKLWRNLAIELKGRLIRTNELVDHYVDLAQVLRDNPGYADILGVI